MKNNLFLILIGIFLVLLLGNFVKADVGVGISPSKIVLQIEGGQTQNYELLIFNTGSNTLKLNFGIEGDIVKFTEIEKETEIIEPEPKPHELPIKNGKTIMVSFSPPATTKTKEYEGKISAIGSPLEGSQFGGSVGVAAKVQIIVTPTQTFLNYLTPLHYMIAGAILVLIIIIILLKRAGLSVGFRKKK